MITRDYSDKDLRAALGSSPPLEKMKMDKFDRERAEQSLEDEREATQALITELVGALEALIERIDINGGLGEYKGGPAFILANARTLVARAKASHGAGT